MTSKYDLVDVHVTSRTSLLDAVLEHPLLDGEKKYTVQVTEFTCPLTAEPPLMPYEFFANHPLIYVHRRVAGTVPTHADTQLRGVTGLGQFLLQFESFSPDNFTPVRTVNDLVFYLNQYFRNIRNVYSDSQTGLKVNEHGNAAAADNVYISPEDMGNDFFVKAQLTPSGIIQFVCSQLFCEHFYIRVSPYGKTLLGCEDYISFTKDNAGVMHNGLAALTYPPNNPVNYHVKEGSPGETAIQIGSYPITRNFEHRVAIDIESNGMPVPGIIKWLTSNKQSVKYTLASFPIETKYETTIKLDNQGGTLPDVEFTSSMLQGNVVFRRAESKISERFEITNPRFFQNIRLDLLMERRVWDVNAMEYKFQRKQLQLNEGDAWTAKLRFRTLK